METKKQLPEALWEPSGLRNDWQHQLERDGNCHLRSRFSVKSSKPCESKGLLRLP